MSGKGSKRRPEDHKKVAENWDLIFGKKKDKSKENNDKLEKEKKHNES